MRLLIFFLFVSVASGSQTCSKYDFPCEDGGCVDSALWCDSSVDCNDGSDEKYCKASGFLNKDPNKCPSNYFKCNNGPCIPMIGRCDGYDHCEDSSDEKNCGDQSSTPKSESTSSSKPTSSSGPRTSSATTRATPRTTTIKQPAVNFESRYPHISNPADASHHSVEIVYSNVRPSDYTHQINMARAWLLSQRKGDFGWGDETARALTALYLSDVQQAPSRNETDLLMVKQLEVQLALDLARNGTKVLKLTNLALYINALMASCKDAKNFYGENLVQTLRNGVNAIQRTPEFINPSIYLTLCISNASTYDDTRKLHDIFSSKNAAISRIDIQALALLTATCISRNTNFLTSSIYDSFKRQLLQRMNAGGLPGNVYEAALLAQALHEMVTQTGLLEFILKQQREDGSFGGILATYLVLPVLAGRGFLQMNDHCGQRYSTDLSPIEVLKNSKRKTIYVQYSLRYGNPPEISEMIQMKVAEGINFLDVMRLAQEINPKYSFRLDGHRDYPVYSIGGIPNDAEKGMFWTLHLVYNSNRAKGGDGRLTPYSGNLKQLIPQSGDEFVFWMKSI